MGVFCALIFNRYGPMAQLVVASALGIDTVTGIWFKSAGGWGFKSLLGPSFFSPFFFVNAPHPCAVSQCIHHHYNAQNSFQLQQLCYGWIAKWLTRQTWIRSCFCYLLPSGAWVRTSLQSSFFFCVCMCVLIAIVDCCCVWLWLNRFDSISWWSCQYTCMPQFGPWNSTCWCYRLVVRIIGFDPIDLSSNLSNTSFFFVVCVCVCMLACLFVYLLACWLFCSLHILYTSIDARYPKIAITRLKM